MSAFRDERQINAVCVALLERAGMRGWWTEAGPTEKAFGPEYDRISGSERIMVDVALGLWNGFEHHKARVADIIVVLDENNLEAVGSLLVALSRGGGQEVDAWLRSHPRPEVSR